MSWNWEAPDWPRFRWDAGRLARAEVLFAQQAGVLVGSVQHLEPVVRDGFAIQWMTGEAYDTSAIEGEMLDRDSVQSSIQRQLGLKSERRAGPAEAGIAELMVDVYRNIAAPVDETRLFSWHAMVMHGRRDLTVVGGYRTHAEPMQIVSGPFQNQRVHFEAPPSSAVGAEMRAFFSWLEESAPSGTSPLSALTRAGVGHLWFESIHPFEDGNGRIGRALLETMLAQGLARPVLTGAAGTFLRRQKEYYQALEDASRTLDITDWLVWFASAVIEAQRRTEAQLSFVIDKARLMARVSGAINTRQERALLRMFEAGPEGFAGGLSAKNYMTITGAATATATRDLAELVTLGALTRTGDLKSTRYHLAVEPRSIAPVTSDMI
ncbi:Fic family protein [Candidatus Viadribacter manganicus]|uniref:Cell filamentation protein Fic n=1 Tax=Candidatus Viadribacter manganicus TaxID=1759059 RepID=A0A1B1AH90_9PROT|nr:DUF4172 domain-containing protein [Candidatus Viadribacter manganicus]ANP45918.1 cell filamentation protein Fic [Candidatus Viadribacter manganicus]